MTAQVQSLPIDQTDNKHSNDELAYLSAADYFHIEQNRLQTFDQWPVAFIRKEELARYGFYYTGNEDTVKCHFCRVEIGMWEEHDNVIEEHLRWSPYCPLLRKRPTNNVALDRNFLANVPEPSYDVCGINVRTHSYAENASDRMSGDSWSGSSDISSGGNSINGNSIVGEASTSTISTDRSGFMRHGHDEVPLAGGAVASAFSSMGTMGMGSQPCRPEYPMYAIEADRLKSFEDWPTSMSQKPQQLSDAGFFYTGKSDRVKCFSCGGGLKDWEQGDDPWEQHGIWYSNCHYLKLIKGREFIDRCRAMKADEEASSSSSQPSTSGVSSNASSLMSTSPATSSGISSPTPGEDARTSSSSEATVAPKPASSTIGCAVEGDDDAANRGISDGKICKICYVNEYNIAFLPCGHVVACAKCASSVTKCPMCQQPFYNVLKLYLS
uniref:Putative apoptosis 1 inhibitor n=1 Tax=Anopheles braziliensis TaxID=58242 RepID=A0A2M3Z1E4_9DIPT